MTRFKLSLAQDVFARWKKKIPIAALNSFATNCTEDMNVNNNTHCALASKPKKNFSLIVYQSADTMYAIELQ